MPKIVCPHCGRANFKSQRGLTQHVQSSKSCAAAQSATKYGLRSKILDQSTKTTGTVGIDKGALDTILQDVLAEDFLAWRGLSCKGNNTDKLGTAVNKLEETAANASFLHDDIDNAFLFNLNSESDSDASEATLDGHEIFQPNRERIDMFREYCSKQGKKALNLNKDEVSAIKLMYTLRKK